MEPQPLPVFIQGEAGSQRKKVGLDIRLAYIGGESDELRE